MSDGLQITHESYMFELRFSGENEPGSASSFSTSHVTPVAYENSKRIVDGLPEFSFGRGLRPVF